MLAAIDSAPRGPALHARAGAAPWLCALALVAAGCGSRPERGIWDGSFGTGSCANRAPGQFTCTPDPGSAPADCAGQEQGLEFASVGDFSGKNPAFAASSGPGNSRVPAALSWYAYVDRSGVGTISSFTQGWQTPLANDPFPRCGADTPMGLHLQGGPFYGWGGGFGTAAKDWLATPPDPAFDCFMNPTSPFCANKDLPEYLSGAMVDASAYEGIFLWARRGPDSQGGIRINVGDWQTDDDVSFLMYQHDKTQPRHCERVRECACTNHKPCTRWDTSPLDAPGANLEAWQEAMDAEGVQDYQIWSCAGAGSYCEDPAADVVPGYFTTASAVARCNSCALTRCDERYEAYPDGVAGAASVDTQFNGKPCTPFTSRSGIASAYCFDPASEIPAESDEQCGDHFMRGIYLTNDWRLYLVPFTQLLQQGFGKRFPHLDTAHVTMVRLTWDGGYVDFWIGKIGFYRHKPA